MNTLTWNELANWYDENVGGRKARTLPMDLVFETCEKSGHFELTEDGGLLLKEKNRG